MIIIKDIPSDIEEIIKTMPDTLISLPCHFRGGRSSVYKIRDYCLKVYTARGYRDGEAEYDALSNLQQIVYVPELYAYEPGLFTLTEWVYGHNLEDYYKQNRQYPSNFLYDKYRVELIFIQKGYKDWDFKLNENLLWLPSGEVKRIDLGHCEPVGPLRVSLEQNLYNEIYGIYNKDENITEEVHQSLLFDGLTLDDADEALKNFQEYSPKIFIQP